MDTETATNPVEGEDNAAATLPDTQEVEAEGQEQELDDDGEPVTPEPDDEEIELDDLKLKVPKDQAQKVRDALLRQADYTRKTQALAEASKAFEAERAGYQQAGEQEIAAQAHVVAIDQQLAQYQNIDWDAWEEQDPFAAAKGARQLQQLERNRAQAANQFAGLRQQRELATQQETAKRIEDARSVLTRDVPGWGPQLADKLMETGVKQYGFQRGEIEQFSDPRMVKVLHDAHQFRLLQGKQKAAERHEAAQTTQPAARATGASAPAVKLDDRADVSSWMSRRNAQVRKRT